MDWQQIEENWARFKQAIREKWGKLTEDDLEAIAGRRKRMLHKRYGFAADHVRKEVDDWLRWQNFRPQLQGPRRSFSTHRLVNSRCP